MAAGVLSKPGTKYGPCNRKCPHTDCASTRTIAEAACRFCGKPVGYEARFYNDEGYVHAVCLEDAIEAETKKKLSVDQPLNVTFD